MCVPAGLNATIDSEHLDRPNRPSDARLDLRPHRIILDYRSVSGRMPNRTEPPMPAARLSTATQ